MGNEEKRGMEKAVLREDRIGDEKIKEGGGMNIFERVEELISQ